MSTWKRKAIEIAPEKRTDLESVNSPSVVWLYLWPVFEEAVEKNQIKKIKSIISYAFWCLNAKWNSNNGEQIILGGRDFFWWLGTRKKYWQYFKDWFSKSEFEQVNMLMVNAEDKSKVKELQEAYRWGK